MTDYEKKKDAGKDRWDLLPLGGIQLAVRVLTQAVESGKYKSDSWRDVEVERYYSACMRHLADWRNGQDTDKDSGLPTLAHVLCNVIFMIELTGGDE